LRRTTIPEFDKLSSPAWTCDPRPMDEPAVCEQTRAQTDGMAAPRAAGPLTFLFTDVDDAIAAGLAGVQLPSGAQL
jgi:hypothetical protein